MKSHEARQHEPAVIRLFLVLFSRSFICLRETNVISPRHRCLHTYIELTTLPRGFFFFFFNNSVQHRSIPLTKQTNACILLAQSVCQDNKDFAILRFHAGAPYEVCPSLHSFIQIICIPLIITQCLQQQKRTWRSK